VFASTGLLSAHVVAQEPCTADTLRSILSEFGTILSEEEIPDSHRGDATMLVREASESCMEEESDEACMERVQTAAIPEVPRDHRVVRDIVSAGAGVRFVLLVDGEEMVREVGVGEDPSTVISSIPSQDVITIVRIEQTLDPATRAASVRLVRDITDPDELPPGVTFALHAEHELHSDIVQAVSRAAVDRGIQSTQFQWNEREDTYIISLACPLPESDHDPWAPVETTAP